MDDTSSDLPGEMKNEPEIFQMCAADIIWNQSLLNKDQVRRGPGNKCVLSQVYCWLKTRPDSGHSHRLFCFIFGNLSVTSIYAEPRSCVQWVIWPRSFSKSTYCLNFGLWISSSMIPDYCCTRSGGGVITPDKKSIPASIALNQGCDSAHQLPGKRYSEHACTHTHIHILKVCVCHLGNSCGGRRWCNDKNGLNLHLQYIYTSARVCTACFRVLLNVHY